MKNFPILTNFKIKFAKIIEKLTNTRIVHIASIELIEQQNTI